VTLSLLDLIKPVFVLNPEGCLLLYAD